MPDSDSAQVTFPLLQYDLPRHNRIWRQCAIFMPALVYATITLTLMLGNFHASRAEWDQGYHLDVIKQFSREWPHFDFRDYRSATTPGYHLVVAAFAHMGITQLLTLRLIGWLFSLALVVELCIHASTLGSPTGAAILLPFVMSSYVVTSGAWLLPDNAGWLGLLAVLAISMRRQFDWKTLVLGSTFLFGLVWIRQVHVWAAVALWLNALFADTGICKNRARCVGAMVMGTLPALITVAGFGWLWHGFTPPSIGDEIYHAWYIPGNIILKSPNFSTPAVVLSVFAVFSTFFGEFLFAARSRLLENMPKIWIGFVIGFAIAVFVSTDYAYGSRSSGIWNIVAHLPSLFHRSILIVPLSAIGAAMLVAWTIIMRRPQQIIWTASWVCFIAAQSMNPSAFQRYFEPFALMMLVLGVINLDTQSAKLRKIWIGPCLLAILLCVVLALSLRFPSA